MVLTQKTNSATVLFFIFTLQSFQNGIVRKLAGLANQHKKLVLLGTIGVLLMSTVKPMLMQFSGCPV
jgi:hypothetical protein